MYYVNREQIELRLQAIPEITEGMRHISSGWTGSLMQGLVQERCLHLAIETVTDVGSYLIDGFIMRDASSYEDIISIIYEEKVIDEFVHAPIYELVSLRKPLVQEYFRWKRAELHPLTSLLPGILERFVISVASYLDRELGSQSVRSTT